MNKKFQFEGVDKMSQLISQKSTINLPVLTDPERVASVVALNLDGITPEFPRIKFPSGGLLAFEVPGDDGSPDVAKELVGVIVDHISSNSFWKESYDGSTNAPDCNSVDGKVGISPIGARVEWAGKTQNCMSCPFNQWGSGLNGGKACKNMRKIFLVREGEILPLEITIPPSSVNAWINYTVQLTSKVKPIDGVVTRIKLKKAISKGGIEYSEGVFQKVADLSDIEIKQIRKYSTSLRASIRNNAPAPSIQEIHHDDEDIPF